ncbi:hypothetical protein QBC34DRAFT_73835 [Podospora aff. communis PSN243]|uniref:Uncharacterized protein n=1 Tax=Podospora aff. communis PSN243 TaxID=3040156 RepID=A0AAV9H3S6_9PEZI|nr:hypothetical protein QBC34DRAFT_73835 [Podospora aff. communis PSN243]
MFGSYGSSSSSSSYSSSYNSYSSYSSMSSPMDIAPTPFSSRSPDASCAFPSWPRRTSLCEPDSSEERATSYLSDEDLFFDVFDDDARSVSSNGSASPVVSPPTTNIMTDAEIFEMQRERAAYQRDVMRTLLNEKEQRRRQQQQAAKRQRRSSGGSSSKKGPKSKLSAMTPIAEAE